MINLRLAAVLLLGFSSGLPFHLSRGTLQAWLTAEGVSLEVIGATSLLGLPYALKFLWAPLLDSTAVPELGRRRSWILGSSFLLSGLTFLLLRSDPGEHLGQIFAVALGIAVASATLDIAVDGFRVDYLKESERGWGAAVATFGYRLGLLASGALALIVADRYGWESSFWLVMGMMLVGIVTVLVLDEPTESAVSQLGWVAPFLEILLRPHARSLLAFVLLYRFGDALAGTMTVPFILQRGYSLSDLGEIAKGAGIVAAIAGSFFGAALLDQLGLRLSLLIFGVLQMMSTAAYVVLSSLEVSRLNLLLVMGFENVTAGMGSSAFVALLMGVCDRRFSGTQYALLTATAVVGGSIGGAFTGSVAEAVSWNIFFIGAALAGIPSLLILRLQFDNWQAR